MISLIYYLGEFMKDSEWKLCNMSASPLGCGLVSGREYVNFPLYSQSLTLGLGLTTCSTNVGE